MPVNALIGKSLLLLYQYYGNSFTVECPTGSGVQKTLFEVAKEISGSAWGISFGVIKMDADRCSEIRRSFRRTRTGAIICCL